MDDDIILEKLLYITHKIGSKMCFWVLTMLVKVVARTTVHNAICTDFIDPYMKRSIGNFDEQLYKRLDDTNIIDDVGADFYIDNLDEADEAVRGDGSNTPSD